MNYFKKHIRAIFCISIVLLLVPAMVWGAGEKQEKKLLNIAGSTLGSTGYEHFEALSYIINQFSDKYKCSSFATSGSSENIILLEEGKLDLGSAGCQDVYAAWSGERWDREIPIWQVATYTYWALPMITLAGRTEIEKIEDLKGKSISIASVGSGTEYMWRLILTEYGIYDDIKVNNLGWAEGYEALVDGLIVAAPGNFPGGKPNPEMIRLATRRPYKVLNIDKEIFNRVRKINPGIIGATLPKEAYEGLEEDVFCPGNYGIVVSIASVDDDKVYNFCKTLYEHIDTLHEVSSVSDYSTLENALKGFLPEYPVHPGAARYYKEIGVWDDSLIVGKR